MLRQSLTMTDNLVDGACTCLQIPYAHSPYLYSSAPPRDLARELDPSCSDDDLSTSDSVSAQATRKITKAEAEALLTDYPALMKHRFIAEADTENPDRWNVSSVMLPRDMHAQYSIGLEGCGPDIVQMDSSELLTRLMESQFDEA